MAELEKIPDKKEKLSNFQGKYNTASKTVAQRLGTNIALYICVLLPAVLIGFIWTDFGIPQIGIKFISEGIVTVALFFIGETMMMTVGSGGGKLDKEYIDAKNEFESLIDKVNGIGTMLMTVFLKFQPSSMRRMKLMMAVRKG